MMGEEPERPVSGTVEAPGRRNLRPPWKKGQSGNPKGNSSAAEARRRFDEALTNAVLKQHPELIARLVGDALAGNEQQMRTLINKIVPNIDRHELDAGAAVSKMVIEFAKPEKETDSGDAG